MRGKAGNTQMPPPQAPMEAKPSEVAEEGKKPTDAMPAGAPEKPAETPPPPAGHNQPPTIPSMLLTEAGDRAAYYAQVKHNAMRHQGKIADLSAQLKTLRGELSQIFKEGKARLGFNREDFEYGIELGQSRQSSDGGSTALETHKRRLEVATWEGHPIAQYQLDLDLKGGEDGVDRTPSVDRAFDEGLIVGRKPIENGETEADHSSKCSPPTNYGPAQAQGWMRGWHEGNSQRMTMLNKLRPLQDGGLWPDDPQPEEGLGPIYDPEAEHPAVEDHELAEAVADGLRDAVSNVVPIGKAPSTADVL